MVVCRLRHLCRAVQSSLTRVVPHFWSRGTLPLSISLGHFRLIGTYNQFFIPCNQVSHIRISFALPFPCTVAHFLSLSHLGLLAYPSVVPNQTLKTSTFLHSPPLFIPLLFLLRRWLTTLSLEIYTTSIHAMTCILPPSFFDLSSSHFPGGTVYLPFLLFTLPTTNRVAFLSPSTHPILLSYYPFPSNPSLRSGYCFRACT